jgi:leader peptidase (prepilin peptidase)/N-methyltransferase
MTLAGLRTTIARARVGEFAARLPVALTLIVLGVLAVGVRPLVVGLIAIALVTETLVRVDITHHRLPNRIVLPLYPVIVVSVTVDCVVRGVLPFVAIGAGMGWFCFLLLLCLAGGMGMGDVKLGGALGLCLGALGAVTAGAGLLIAFGLGAVAGLVVIVGSAGVAGEPRLTRRIPFGPFLLAGFWLVVAGFPLLIGRTA